MDKTVPQQSLLREVQGTIVFWIFLLIFSPSHIKHLYYFKCFLLWVLLSSCKRWHEVPWGLGIDSLICPGGRGHLFLPLESLVYSGMMWRESTAGQVWTPPFRYKTSQQTPQGLLHDPSEAWGRASMVFYEISLQGLWIFKDTHRTGVTKSKTWLFKRLTSSKYQICHRYLPWQNSVAETYWKPSFSEFIANFQKLLCQIPPEAEKPRIGRTKDKKDLYCSFPAKCSHSANPGHPWEKREQEAGKGEV